MVVIVSYATAVGPDAARDSGAKRHEGIVAADMDSAHR